MTRQMTSLPQILIAVDGTPLPSREVAALVGIRVQQKLSLPTLCEITFREETDFLGGSDLLSLGADMSVKLDAFETSLFTGQVTAVEHLYEAGNRRTIRLRAYDKLHLLRKHQAVRTFVQITLEDLINELVKDLSFTVEMNENTPLRERIIQFDQTDLDLITEIAQRNGLYFFVSEDMLNVFTLQGAGETIELRLGENLFEARVEVNSDKICRKVSTTGWSTLRVERFEGSAEVERSGRSIGVEIDDAKFGDSFEHALVDENINDESEAAALSQAELDWSAAREVSLWGVAEGDTRLQPGSTVEIAGIQQDLNGSYVLASVNHTIDIEKGFVSEISTVPPTPILRPRSSLATYGVVTGLDDPEGFGRVRVKLPNYSDVETDWMQVLSAGAGIGKGLVALPDIDDTVLVFFPRGELTQGVVLGGLYGTAQRDGWDWGIDDSKTKRFRLQTAGNQKISFDDVNKILRMENSEGSFVEMSPEKVSLHAKTDLEIAAPGRAIVIKGKTIDFERMEDADTN